MKEMRVASIAFAAYLVTSAENVHEQDGVPGAHERGIQLGHDVPGIVAVHAGRRDRAS